MVLAVGLVAFGAPAASALPIGPQPPILDEPGQVIDPPDDPIASYPMVHDITASQVTDLQVGLSAGVRTVFETIGLSTGADPVLHLLSPSGSQVAMDDNSGPGLGARISYVAPTSGTYRLIGRARTNATGGTGILTRNGGPLVVTARFGGWQLTLEGLRTREVVETVRLPNGARPYHALYQLALDGRLERRTSSGGTAGAASYASTVIGTRTVMVATESTGRVRLLRNDAARIGHDDDRDGLGVELERDLGTCAVRGNTAKGFNCALAADARDTDGDGISDGWETLGRRDAQPHQPLPLWGANPRHKDLFIEIDFALRKQDEAAQRLQPEQADALAAAYEDRVGALTSAQRAAHAATLRNPDGREGISVHLDTGVSPTVSALATRFGNWGGYSVVPPVDLGDEKWGKADDSTAWRQYLSPARYGIFRYGLADGSTDGASTGSNAFAFSFGIDSGRQGAHELGHGMGLGHSGPSRATGDIDPNCKPNFPSIMNYAFTYEDGIGFSDGVGAPALNNAALREWQSVTANDPEYFDVLENTFQYQVDRSAGHVDWNRDGVFAPSGSTVRAYANFAPDASCEFTRYNRVPVSTALTSASPALARLGNRLYAFYVEGGVLRYASSTSSWSCPAMDNEGCGDAVWGSERDAGLTAVAGFDVERVRWGAGRQPQLLVVAMDGDGRLRQRRLSVDASGSESWSATSLLASTPAAGEPSLVADGSGAWLAYKGRSDRLLRANHLTTDDTGSTWAGEQLARTPTGDTIPVYASASPALVYAALPHAPGRRQVYAAVAGNTGTLALWCLCPQFPQDAQQAIVLPGPTQSLWAWERTDLLEGSRAVGGRPAMAWVPGTHAGDYPGRLYLAYNREGTIVDGTWATAPTTYWMMSYRRADGTERIGLHSPFDNTWFISFGIDLLYEPGVDQNVRSLTASASLKPALNMTVTFRPKADGIHDFEYTDFNEWATIRTGLCRNVVNPGGLVIPPRVTCP